MTIQEQIQRSKSKDSIDFNAIGCLQQEDPLVPLTSTSKLEVRPVWKLDEDLEGAMYRRYTSENPHYDAMYVRSELALRLMTASESLDDRYKLIVQAGHRPLQVQIDTLNGFKNNYLAEHPKASFDEALAHARMYVSDPEVELPSHCCGAAVDVYLYDIVANKVVDFGSPVNLDHKISYLHTIFINTEQQSNRMILLTAMLQSGFASAANEWWHYSYGDQVWAWFYGKEDCLFGLVEV